MNKKFLSVFAGFMILTAIFTSGFKFWGKKVEEVKTPVITQSYEEIKDKAWCVTFQLVWNDFMDRVNYGKPILLAGGNPAVATELNRRLYTTSILNENSYIKKEGVVNKKLKRQIEKEIKRKFNETSDILEMINWNAKNSYLFYAMLKKDFQFTTPFDKLEADTFANGENKVKYFGIDKKSKPELRDNVNVLFYNSDKDYAVKLVTKQGEEVLLYKTDKKDSFENLYTYITQQTKNAKFESEDTLKIPDIKLDKTITYPELCNKRIKGTNKMITQAIQTIKFNMDNKGGTLKSEAALVVMKMSLNPVVGKNYNFDDEFVMFLKEAKKNKPYFAARVSDEEFLVKE